MVVINNVTREITTKTLDHYISRIIGVNKNENFLTFRNMNMNNGSQLIKKVMAVKIIRFGVKCIS